MSLSAIPHPTSHPGWFAAVKASATSADLPMPGSPSTQTSAPSPRSRASTPARRIASSCSRPTQCGGNPIGHMTVKVCPALSKCPAIARTSGPARTGVERGCRQRHRHEQRGRACQQQPGLWPGDMRTRKPREHHASPHCGVDDRHRAVRVLGPKAPPVATVDSMLLEDRHHRDGWIFWRTLYLP